MLLLDNKMNHLLKNIVSKKFYNNGSGIALSKPQALRYCLCSLSRKFINVVLPTLKTSILQKMCSMKYKLFQNKKKLHWKAEKHGKKSIH